MRYPDSVGRLPILLLVLFALAPWSRAEEETRSLRVLASPALPTGLLERVPGREVHGRIRWPLPEGDLLVLGVPCQNVEAHHFGTAFAIREVGECLFGGYAIARWKEGDRWISTVLAHDFVALRRGLKALLAHEGPLPTKNIRPRFQIRALAAADEEKPGNALVELALRSGANRVLFHPGTAQRWPGPMRKTVQRLLAQGIQPGWRTPTPALFADLPDVNPVMEIWAEGAGPKAVGPARGAVWTRESSHPVTLAEARAARHRFGKRILLDERPHQPKTGEHRGRIPSLPRGRDPGLGAPLEGVLVAPGPNGELLLEAAWRTTPELEDPWRYHLLPYLPRRWDSPADLLAKSARNLGRIADAPRWISDLALRLEVDAHNAGIEKEPFLEVPHVPQAPEVDGRLDDPAWGFASTLDLEDGAKLFALTDGHGLHLGIRAPKATLHYRVTIHDPVAGRTTLTVAGRGAITHESERGTTHAARRGDNEWTAEMRVGADALGGDACPTRLIDMDVRHVSSGRVIWKGMLLLVP